MEGHDFFLTSLAMEGCGFFFLVSLAREGRDFFLLLAKEGKTASSRRRPGTGMAASSSCRR
jgi:hypothetical protein